MTIKYSTVSKGVAVKGVAVLYKAGGRTPFFAACLVQAIDVETLRSAQRRAYGTAEEPARTMWAGRPCQSPHLEPAPLNLKKQT